MNIWYTSSLIIVIVALIFVVVCSIISFVSMAKTATVLNHTLTSMQQKQLQPLQQEANALNVKLNTIKQDVEQKQNDLKYVTECFNGIKQNVNDLTISSKRMTSKIIERTENDPHVKSQTEQWTNTALGFLNRQK